MFRSARIKLTIWYVLISMIISILFSVTIFSLMHEGFTRNERRFEFRMEPFRSFDPDFQNHIETQRRDMELIEQRLIINLLYVNLLILGISTVAGYFLAGRTLRPIQESVDKQNQFIADASHELRTPLTALQTAIEVNLRDKALDLKQAKLVLEENLTDVQKLKNLSNNLLTLATLQTAPTQPLSDVSLKEAVDSAVNTVAALAKSKKIRIESKIADVTINAEKTRLTDLFVIFLDNAIKYSPTKSRIEMTSVLSGGMAEIRIKDNGTGIAKEDIPHIFERFYRGDKSRSREYTDGYGLGLSIAKQIIDTYKGTVTVSSTLKKGTTFVIKLPTKK